MDWYSSSIWYWTVLSITAIISGVLGYFFGKSDAPSSSDNFFELNSLEIENAKLKSDLETCRKKLDAVDIKSKSLHLDPEIKSFQRKEFHFQAQHAKATFGKAIKENDLKLIEGIGPKIEELFHNYNIKTWRSLSETSVDKCQEILNSGGSRYRIHDPASWPMQAKMAYEGHWEQLYIWQEKHKAGKY